MLERWRAQDNQTPGPFFGVHGRVAVRRTRPEFLACVQFFILAARTLPMLCAPDSTTVALIESLKPLLPAHGTLCVSLFC